MRFSSQLVGASLATLSSFALADLIGPVNIPPYGEVVVEISAKTTLNSTSPVNYVSNSTKHTRDEDFVPALEIRQNSANVKFQFYQFAFGRGTKVNVYITGKDNSNDGHQGAVGFVNAQGQWYYPQGNPSSTTPTPVDDSKIRIPIPDDTSAFNVTLPGAITSGQILFAVNGSIAFMTNVNKDGSVALVNPSAANPMDASTNVFWGFTEFTYSGGNSLDINPTAVDFVGCPNPFAVYGKSGGGNFSAGILPNAAPKVANLMYNQNNKDGQPWNQLVKYNNKNQLVRVLSPNDYISGNTQAFSGYWENYVNQVWQKYSSTKLTLTTGSTTSTCQVSNNVMTCTGDNMNYNKPTTSDIFSCNSGPFANPGAGNQQHQLNVPVLCSAFVRSVILSNAQQPSGPATTYYQTAPTNFYAWAAHNQSYEQNGPPGVGYAFQYDEPHPAGQINPSGNIQRDDTVGVEFFIGGYTNPGQYNPGQYA